MARLPWLSEVLRGAGLTVHEEPGWQTRGSDSFGPIRGITVHATASRNTDRDELDVFIEGRGRPGDENYLAPPIVQLYVGRQGHWWVVASGRCNHNLTGWAGPNKGLGNRNLLGIEAANDNRGEPWPPVQYRSYVRGVAALVRKLGIPVSQVGGHGEHQPDPAPPVPPGEKPNTTKTDPKFPLGMNRFRADVAQALAGLLEEDGMRILHGQVPAGAEATIVCTPWDRSAISFGCGPGGGRARLRVAEHIVGGDWREQVIDISGSDTTRKDLETLLRCDRRSIERVPIDENDKLDTPVGYLAWW
jgi:hypothetical protein